MENSPKPIIAKDNDIALERLIELVKSIFTNEGSTVKEVTITFDQPSPYDENCKESAAENSLLANRSFAADDSEFCSECQRTDQEGRCIKWRYFKCRTI